MFNDRVQHRARTSSVHVADRNGVVCLAQCRPFAQFLQGRRLAASALVNTICRVGWELTNSGASAVLGSFLLPAAPPSRDALQAASWVAAAGSCSNGTPTPGTLQSLNRCLKQMDGACAIGTDLKVYTLFHRAL